MALIVVLGMSRIRLGERLAEPCGRGLVKRAGRAQDGGEPPAGLGRYSLRLHDAPEVATADPGELAGAEASDEDEDEDDDEDDEDDDEVPARVAVSEPDVPAAVACRAEAGSTTAIPTAAAALATPAPAVTAASRVLPRRRACRAVASLSPADSCSVVMIPLRFVSQNGSCDTRVGRATERHVSEVFAAALNRAPARPSAQPQSSLTAR